MKVTITVTDEELAALDLLCRGRQVRIVAGTLNAAPEDRLLARLLAASHEEQIQRPLPEPIVRTVIDPSPMTRGEAQAYLTRHAVCGCAAFWWMDPPGVIRCASHWSGGGPFAGEVPVPDRFAEAREALGMEVLAEVANPLPLVPYPSTEPERT